MIRRILNPMAAWLGYVPRSVAVKVDHGRPVPFTRQQVEGALNLGFVKGVPHDCRIETFGRGNQDMRITLVFRHRDSEGDQHG